MSLIDRLKPTDREIRDLALRETDSALAHRFDPIARGPVFAVLALVVVGVALALGLA